MKEFVIIDNIPYVKRKISSYKFKPNLKVYKVISENYFKHIKSIIIDDEYIYEQYVTGRTLDNFYDENIKIKNKILNQIIDGVESLHKLNIIHRDLKPENIIVDQNYNVYIIDYDISRFYNKLDMVSNDTTLIGTYKYCPPEQYGFSQTNFSSDIYSLGIIMGELFENCKKYIFIINKATNLDPNKRYQNISKMRKNINFGDDNKLIYHILFAIMILLYISLNLLNIIQSIIIYSILFYLHLKICNKRLLINKFLNLICKLFIYFYGLSILFSFLGAVITTLFV